jgi:hypothetical protein
VEKKDISHEWQVTRVGLFLPGNRQKLKREMKEDEEAIYAAFRAGGDDQRALRLFQHFKRYLLNTSALASYHGLLRGYECFELGSQLPKGSAKRCIIEYLYSNEQNTGQRKVRNRELCEHLSKKRVPILETWQQKIDGCLKTTVGKRKFEKRFVVEQSDQDNKWNEAMFVCPELVGPYLSHYRREAKNAMIRNALHLWPKIVRASKKTV